MYDWATWGLDSLPKGFVMEQTGRFLSHLESDLNLIELWYKLPIPTLLMPICWVSKLWSNSGTTICQTKFRSLYLVDKISILLFCMHRKKSLQFKKKNSVKILFKFLEDILVFLQGYFRFTWCSFSVALVGAQHNPFVTESFFLAAHNYCHNVAKIYRRARFFFLNL